MLEKLFITYKQYDKYKKRVIQKELLEFLKTDKTISEIKEYKKESDMEVEFIKLNENGENS